MKATEIIRGVLDLIDQVECAQQENPVDVIGGEFAQLFAQMTATPPQGYDNSPEPHVQDIHSVTTNAGGGLNGPKNPADIRSDSVSMYPAYQAERK